MYVLTHMLLYYLSFLLPILLRAEEEDDDDDVEKDGGGMSRHKTHQNVSPSSKGHKSSTMVIKRKHEAIKIRNVPPDFSLPGRMYVSETGQTIVRHI